MIYYYFFWYFSLKFHLIVLKKWKCSHNQQMHCISTINPLVPSLIYVIFYERNGYFDLLEVQRIYLISSSWFVFLCLLEWFDYLNNSKCFEKLCVKNFQQKYFSIAIRVNFSLSHTQSHSLSPSFFVNRLM